MHVYSKHLSALGAVIAFYIYLSLFRGRPPFFPSSDFSSSSSVKNYLAALQRVETIELAKSSRPIST